MTVAYAWQLKLVKAGACPVCMGTKRVGVGYDEDGSEGIGTCQHCGGTGKPTEEDRADVGVLESGICVACGLPLLPDKEPNPDCKEHLLQEVHRLRKKVG